MKQLLQFDIYNMKCIFEYIIGPLIYIDKPLKC
jgi:hypothetical protein